MVGVWIRGWRVRLRLALATHVQVNGAGSAGVAVGEFVVEPATLINLGFEWYVDGDDNRNATVDVSYRKAGQSSWSSGLPLLRLQAERNK